jgi:hypothetical protein
LTTRTSQWRSDKGRLDLFETAAKKFRDDTTTFLAARKYEAEQKSGKRVVIVLRSRRITHLVPPTPAHHQHQRRCSTPESKGSSFKIIASPSMLEILHFSKNDLSEKDLQLIFEATCIDLLRVRR